MWTKIPMSEKITVTHCALNPMYFENTGHLGGVAEDDIQRISMTLPKFPVYLGDAILRDPAQMSGALVIFFYSVVLQDLFGINKIDLQEM